VVVSALNAIGAKDSPAASSSDIQLPGSAALPAGLSLANLQEARSSYSSEKELVKRLATILLSGFP
jgi:hypothetical protein